MSSETRRNETSVDEKLLGLDPEEKALWKARVRNVSDSTIADLLDIHQRTVSEWTSELEEEGFLQSRGKRGAKTYSSPPEFQSSAHQDITLEETFGRDLYVMTGAIEGEKREETRRKILERGLEFGDNSSYVSNIRLKLVDNDYLQAEGRTRGKRYQAGEELVERLRMLERINSPEDEVTGFSDENLEILDRLDEELMQDHPPPQLDVLTPGYDVEDFSQIYDTESVSGELKERSEIYIVAEQLAETLDAGLNVIDYNPSYWDEFISEVEERNESEDESRQEREIFTQWDGESNNRSFRNNHTGNRRSSRRTPGRGSEGFRPGTSPNPESREELERRRKLENKGRLREQSNGNKREDLDLEPVHNILEDRGLEDIAELNQDLHTLEPEVKVVEMVETDGGETWGKHYGSGLPYVIEGAEPGVEYALVEIGGSIEGSRPQKTAEVLEPLDSYKI